LQTADFDRSALDRPLNGTMKAAVYTGASSISVAAVPVPEIGPGEILVRVEACGICHTDLKKIEYNLLPAPRVFGHETAGTVVAVGAGVTRFRTGDNVIAFHHIPCRNCFYCQHKLYAQCPGYKRVGITAGYGEPAGGGFAQYVRVMDWIVRSGVEKMPPGVPFDRAAFVEPINTCLKAVVQVDPQPGEVTAILGQGPIGLMFTMLVKRTGARIFTTDTFPARRALSERFGSEAAYDPREPAFEEALRRATGGRGADLAIVAASVPGIVQQAMRISRPGSRVLLFAQTSHQERVEVSGADICVGERTLCGAYSASIDLQKQSADLVFSGELPVEELISHRVPLEQIRSGIELALHPNEQSLKIVVQPQRSK
jgi:L-iditol 2-dehydrogenase